MALVSDVARTQVEAECALLSCAGPPGAHLEVRGFLLAVPWGWRLVDHQSDCWADEHTSGLLPLVLVTWNEGGAPPSYMGVSYWGTWRRRVACGAVTASVSIFGSFPLVCFG